LWGLPGAVLSLVISSLLLMTLSHQGIRKEAARAGVPMSREGWGLEKGVLWRFSLPTVLGGAVYVPVMWLANVVIVNTPRGYSAMGVFSAADRWRTAVMFVPTLMGGVTLPLLTSLLGEANPRRYDKVLWASVVMSGLAAAALAIPIAAFSPWIMASYGPDFEQGRWALMALCVSSVAASSYWIISQSLISRARVWAMFWLNVEWAILFVSSVWILRHLGATGLAAAYLVADSLRLGTALLFMAGRHVPGLAIPVVEKSSSPDI
jgi:O-antigen/teichoic acid export membrane protein